MRFQEFCVRQIKNALDLDLTDEQLESGPFKHALRVGLVRAYAETYYLRAQRCEFRFEDRNYGANRILGAHEVWTSLLCSEKAYKRCDSMEDRDYDKKKRVCYEHIEPADFVYEKLVALNGKKTSEVKIKRILDRCKLVVMTKEEMDYLDKNPHTSFTEKDEELIEQWHEEGFISARIKNEALANMEGSTKISGTAHARLAHLVNKGVRFRWDKRPDLGGGALIAAYLKDHSHNI